MGSKLKKTVLVLILLTFSWSLWAGEKFVLDLDTALSMALANDLNFRIATINYERSKLEQEKREANYLLQASRYNELEMEMSRISLENNYRNTVNNLVSRIINEYSSLWLAGLDLEIKEKSFLLEELRLEEARKQYEIGDIGSISLLDQENSYNNAEFNLAIARDDYQQRIKEFSRQLDPLEGELELAGLTYREKWPLSEAEALEIALANSTELELARLELVLAEIDQERAGISAAELDKKIKEKALEVARLELEKRKEEFLGKVRDAYYQYQQAHKRIQLNEERLQGAEERYRIREKQYAAGLISKIEVMEYELNLLQARYNYYSSIANLYQAEEGLRQILNRGVSK
ncbi:MAG TPA: TolC family protein [Halanaerobiales bacterium]|nr:TolC family protein [Halanaerobiales bacterium]